MRQFLIQRASVAGDTIIKATHFEVTEIGAFFYGFIGSKLQTIAFYPLKDILSITDAEIKAK